MAADVDLQDVSKVFDDVVAVNNVNLHIQQGEFFSLLGPSGCGKTTTLRMIAGFELPTSGEIFIDGKPMGGTPPFQRNVNTVFQSYALFPHMTVAENIAFGLQMKRVAKAEIKRRVDEALQLVRLPGYGDRRPKQLSGGQQQRVALARALINRPGVLLLDEPLGALDLKLRKEMQLELKHLQTTVGITFIYVTHDQEEALTMSDRIAVMDAGRVLQVGTPTEIYEEPADRFVADFIGESNFLPGHVRDLDAEWATVLVDERLPLKVRSRAGVSAGADVTVAIRPEKIRIAADGNGNGSIDYQLDGWLPGRVEERVYIGTDTYYVVRLSDRTTVRVRAQNTGHDGETVPIGPGAGVSVLWSAESARLLTT